MYLQQTKHLQMVVQKRFFYLTIGITTKHCYFFDVLCFFLSFNLRTHISEHSLTSWNCRSWLLYKPHSKGLQMLIDKTCQHSKSNLETWLNTHYRDTALSFKYNKTTMNCLMQDTQLIEILNAQDKQQSGLQGKNGHLVFKAYNKNK